MTTPRLVVKPTVRITDPKFTYTPWYATDIRKTFEKERVRLSTLPPSNKYLPGDSE